MAMENNALFNRKWWFSTGAILSPKDIWQCLETFYNRQDSPALYNKESSSSKCKQCWENPGQKKQGFGRQNTSLELHLDLYESHFYPHGNTQFSYTFPLQNSFFTPWYLSALEILQEHLDLTYFSTHLPLLPKRSFLLAKMNYSIAWLSLTEMLLPPNKQSSFV